MRYLTLVEQTASFLSGDFTLGDEIPGRRSWSEAAGSAAGRHYYLAQLLSDTSIWEMGIGDFDGSGTVSRVSVLNSAFGGATAIDFDGDVSLAVIAPAGAYVVLDPESANDALRSAQAFGFSAMAVGPGAEAYGEAALAIGQLAQAGTGLDSAVGAVAIGPGALATEFGAVALGKSARSFLSDGIHGNGSVWWSAFQNYTSDATPLLLTSQNFALPTLPVDTAMVLHGTVVARRDGAAGYYSAEIKALIQRGSSGAVVVVGTPIVTEIAKTGGVAHVVDVVPDGTEGQFGIECTGAAAQDWVWSATFVGVRA